MWVAVPFFTTNNTVKLSNTVIQNRQNKDLITIYSLMNVENCAECSSNGIASLLSIGTVHFRF